VKKRSYLIVALAAAIVLSGSIYAYTYLTAGGMITVTELEDIATTNATATQPDWDSVTANLSEKLIVQEDLETASGTAITLNVPNVTVTGANRVLYVFVTMNNDFYETTSSVKWKSGVSEQDFGSAIATIADDDDAQTEVFRLVAPTTGTDTVYCTFSAAVGTGVAAAVLSLSGVDQTTPNGTVATDYLTDQTDFDLTVTSGGSTEVVYAAVACEYGTLTSDDPGSEIWNLTQTNHQSAGGKKTGASPNVTFGWGSGFISHWAAAGFSVKPAPTADPTLGEVPTGDLFTVNPNPAYSGDLQVDVYLSNTSNLAKAYQYLNMELYLESSVSANETPNHRLITLQNGRAAFTLLNIAPAEAVWTQTSQADFEAGTLYQVDTTTSPGDVLLDTFSDNVSDNFTDESKIASKTNLVVTGGQVKLTSTDGTETLRPNAAGTYTQCDPIGDSPNWQCVDEAIPDSNTYVRTVGGATELDTYNIPDHSEGSGSINSVTVYTRSEGSSGVGRHDAQTVIRTYGTNYFGTVTALDTDWMNISTIYTTNPYTTDNWAWDEIDALEIGVRQYDNGGGYPRTTQVYVEVDYTTYDSPGILTSINLLSGETVKSIDSFGYTASAIPSGTDLKVQFSTDNTTWYNSAGTPGGWDTMSQGTHAIDLSGLGWSGANFYYKMEFTSDGTATPVLDDIIVNFSSSYTSGTLTSSAYDSAWATDWITISFTVDEPSGTDIKFQIRTATTEAGLSTATWYGPTSTTDYYQTSGNATNPVHDGDQWIQCKAYFSGLVDDTPTLSDVSIAYESPGIPYLLEVIGGGYGLVSDNISDWGAGWTVTPEFYCEVTQR